MNAAHVMTSDGDSRSYLKNELLTDSIAQGLFVGGRQEGRHNHAPSMLSFAGSRNIHRGRAMRRRAAVLSAVCTVAFSFAVPLFAQAPAAVSAKIWTDRAPEIEAYLKTAEVVGMEDL